MIVIFLSICILGIYKYGIHLVISGYLPELVFNYNHYDKELS
jgi:hypothetical protein